MDVSSAKVCDEDGFVSRGMTIEAHDVVMKDQFWIIRVISNTVFRTQHADAGAPLHDERVLLPWDARVTS